MEIQTYKEVLDRVVRTAHEGRNTITEETYRELTAPLSLTEEQDRLTREYLKGLHIRFGTPEPEEREEDLPLREADSGYLEYYLLELDALPRRGAEEIPDLIRRAIQDEREAKEALVQYHLRDVVEIAKLYVYHGLALSDLIGEGNIGLMTAVDLLGTLDSPEEAEGFIGKTIMDAMDAAIAADTEDRSGIDAVLTRMSDIGRAAKELSEDLRREVTPSELAAETEFTEEEIAEALRLTGNNIEGLTRG